MCGQQMLSGGRTARPMISIAPTEGVPALSAADDQLLQLFRRLRNPAPSDDVIDLRNRIILAKHDLVRCLASKFSRDVNQRADLEGEGLLGLLEAIDRFDPSHEVPFGAYAVHFVRARIWRRMYADRDLRFDGRVAARLTKVRRAVSDDGRPAELIRDEELASATGLPLGSVRRLRPFIPELQHLDYTTSDGAERIETAADRDARTPACVAEASCDSEVLARVRLTLSEREAKIIRWAFGFDGEPRPSTEIALDLGISRQRVDQIKERALQKLREAGWSDAFRRRGQTVSPYGRSVCAVA